MKPNGKAEQLVHSRACASKKISWQRRNLHLASRLLVRVLFSEVFLSTLAPAILRTAVKDGRLCEYERSPVVTGARRERSQLTAYGKPFNSAYNTDERTDALPGGEWNEKI